MDVSELKNFKVIDYSYKEPVSVGPKNNESYDLLKKLSENDSEELFMCIDEGLAGTGIAIFRVGSVYPIFNKSYTFKTDIDYMNMIQALVSFCNIENVFCEDVSYQGTGSVKGQAAAESGGLVKLSKFAGSLRGFIYGYYRGAVKFEFVPVVTWKGQLPKDVVKNRILKILPNIKTTNHDWDAVGIGLFLQGVLHAKQENHKNFVIKSKDFHNNLL